MKILQVGSALHDWGGIERYLLYLTQGLAERGHEVWATVPPGSPLDKKLTCNKAHISLKRQFQFSLLPAYMRFFRRHKFDVVNTHFSPDFIVPAIAARLAGQRNTVLTRHVVLYWKPAKVRRYTRLFESFIGVSDAVKVRLTDSGVPADRIAVAKAGCPALEATLPVETVRAQMAIPGFSVGFFGRVVDDKGVRTLAEAAKSLPPETMHVFGDGPLLSELKKEGGPVRYHGRVEDVANAMTAMDAIVIPSLWEEAFPYSALEAMSLGKPVLATRSGGLPEMVQEGVNGHLFEKRDAGKLVEIIRELSQNPDHVAKLGAAGQEIHRSTYTIACMAERMEAAYEGFIGG
ncbi:MAG: glycosyltransferase family 4 protein [Fimbriimonadaceae bacterium]